MDFVYQQYAMTLADITMMQNFEKIVSYNPDNTNSTPHDYYRELGEYGDNPQGGTIARTVLAKIDGALYIIMFDKKLLNQKNTPLYFTFSSFDINEVNLYAIRDDPLFQILLKEKLRKTAFGKLKEKIFESFEVEDRPVIIYPYYSNQNDSLQTILLVLLRKDFLCNFYKDINSLQSGTLYILDKFNNVLSKSHPGSDDYFEYDKQENKYVKDDNSDIIDYDTKMSFSDYSLLNTEQNILQHKKFRICYWQLIYSFLILRNQIFIKPINRLLLYVIKKSSI